jgi:hypothetical protein
VLIDAVVRAVLRLLLRDKSELPNQALAITKTIPSKSSCGRDKRKGFHSKRRMMTAKGKERSDTPSSISSTRYAKTPNKKMSR